MAEQRMKEIVAISTANSQKEVIALSTARYRGVAIMETTEGVTFFVGNNRYDQLDLAEAKACIDAIYSTVIVQQ